MGFRGETETLSGVTATASALGRFLLANKKLDRGTGSTGDFADALLTHVAGRQRWAGLAGDPFFGILVPDVREQTQSQLVFQPLDLAPELIAISGGGPVLPHTAQLRLQTTKFFHAKASLEPNQPA